MGQMIRGRFSLWTIFGVWGIFLLCALPLEAGRHGVYKDPSLLGKDHRTLGRHRAKMIQKLGDLSQDRLPQKPLITKRSRLSLSSAVTSRDFEGKASGRIDAGRNRGLFLTLLLLMSVASPVEGQVFHLEPQCGGLVVLEGAVVCGCPGGERCGLMTPDSMSSGLSCCAELCCGAGSRTDDHHSLSPTKTFTETSSRSDTLTISCSMASPPIGMTCADGSFYAGKHPVTGAKIYAMNQDSSSRLSWNDGSTNWLDLPAPMDNCVSGTGTAGCHNGKAYTAYLANLTASSLAPYRAAKYCANLVALGYSDWYLPSKDELKMLYTNLGPAPARGFKNYYYWSSSEYNS
jgi:hypothetical protein